MKIAFFSVLKEYQEFFNNSFPKDEVLCFEEKLTKEKLDQIKDFEVLSVFVDSIVDKNIIDNLSNLKFINTRSTGFDHVDYKYAEGKGIAFSNVPVYGSSTVAEFTFALILNLSRKINEAGKQLKEGGIFEALKNTQGFDLDGKVVGVIGTGKIGKNVIRIARAFNMKVLAYDLYPDLAFAKENDFEYKDLNEVFSFSDIITLHAPSTKENYHLINKESISKMKKGVYVINTARGELINTEDLILGVKEGIVGGVGLDVLEGERDFKKGDKIAFFEMPNVIVTPHIAFYSKEAVDRIAKTSIDNIKGFMSGNLQNLVK